MMTDYIIQLSHHYEEFITNFHSWSCFITSVGYFLILDNLKIIEELKKTF